MFRAQLKQLYTEFEAQVETLCQQTGVHLQTWYSPTYIPQPKFVFEEIALDADSLYDEAEFNLLFAPKIPWPSPKDPSSKRSSLTDLFIKSRKKHD
jgi:hypothetical protein